MLCGECGCGEYQENLRGTHSLPRMKTFCLSLSFSFLPLSRTFAWTTSQRPDFSALHRDISRPRYATPSRSMMDDYAQRQEVRQLRPCARVQVAAKSFFFSHLFDDIISYTSISLGISLTLAANSPHSRPAQQQPTATCTVPHCHFKLSVAASRPFRCQ